MKETIRKLAEQGLGDIRVCIVRSWWNEWLAERQPLCGEMDRLGLTVGGVRDLLAFSRRNRVNEKKTAVCDLLAPHTEDGVQKEEIR